MPAKRDTTRQGMGWQALTIASTLTTGLFIGKELSFKEMTYPASPKEPTPFRTAKFLGSLRHWIHGKSSWFDLWHISQW
jgi:hypothetical protein